MYKAALCSSILRIRKKEKDSALMPQKTKSKLFHNFDTKNSFFTL